MLHHLTEVLVAWGPAGILLLAILDSAGMPVAGVFDALLIFISAQRPSLAWVCAAMAVVGSTLGNTILFSAAHRGGRGFMQRAASASRAARFRGWFRRYGMATVFVPALIPIPMPLKLSVISAGVMGTALGEFVGVVVVARLLRYFGEAWLGVTMGHESVAFLKAHAWHFLAGAVTLFAVLVLFLRLRDKTRDEVAA